jgi:hypothetical protein
MTPIGLVAFPWENEGRHGIAFNADSIQPENAIPVKQAS